MTDEANPWDQQPEPPKPGKQPRQRKAREAKPPAEPAAPKARKPRAPKEKAAPETIKVTLKEFAIMRVGEDDAKLFLKLYGLLSGVSKGTRSKFLAELGKVLG